MANETTAATNTIRQNEHPYLKNEENVSYYSSISSLKKIIQMVPLWLKNGNQRVDIQGDLCAEGLIRGGGVTWSNTSVKEKVGLSYRRRNTV